MNEINVISSRAALKMKENNINMYRTPEAVLLRCTLSLIDILFVLRISWSMYARALDL